MKRVYGYEVPLNTSSEAETALACLSKNGVVYFENDDGPRLSVRQELLDIAGAIGLNVFYNERPSHYKLVLFDANGVGRYSA